MQMDASTTRPTATDLDAEIEALWKADIVHIQGTLDSRFRGNDELGLAKSPYISNVNRT